VGELERGDVVLAYYVEVPLLSPPLESGLAYTDSAWANPPLLKPGGACGALADPLDWFGCPVLVTVVYLLESLQHQTQLN
jgi:hypothetical protein